MYEVTVVNGSRQRVVTRYQTPRLGEVIFLSREPWRVIGVSFLRAGGA